MKIKEYIDSLVYTKEIKAAEAILQLVKEEIDWDIEHQEAYLKNDYETDKAIKWRVIGMNALKLRLGVGI